MGSALLALAIGPAAALAANPVPGIDYVNTAEDTPVSGNVLANDSGAGTLTVVSYTPLNASRGALVVATDGAFTYTPAANWNGVVTTTYWLHDDVGLALGYIQLSVSPANDAPVAVDDTVTVVEDTPTDVTGVEANDTDVDHDALSVTAVDNATGGGVELAAGVLTFTPEADACGTGAGSFDYTVSDGDLTDSGSASVDITCVNDAPVAVDDSGVAAQAGGAMDFDVADNDTDVDGDALEASDAEVAAAAGTVAVVAGMVRFTPDPAFTGDAVITYTVSDGDLTDEGVLTVTVEADDVAPVPAAPTLSFGTGRVDETAPIKISWSAVDAGVGVKTYEVQASVGGGAFRTIYAGSATSIKKYYPFATTLVFRVRATDQLDNRSGWATSASRAIRAYQAPGSSAITYTGTWTQVTSSGSSGIGYRYTTTSGRAAMLSFSGTSVLYVAPRTSASGYVKVYVDGRLLGRYNLRTSTTYLGQIVARASWGDFGSHTIRVVNDQGGRRTNLDAFIVLR